MRILIDYRPALRQRTGVGEYAHELARALLPRLGPDDALTLFSSSWKDRLRPEGLEGARLVDTRVPVRLLNFAWHRLGWPAVERFAGEIDVAHAMHPLLLPSRRAAQVVTIHDLYFLDFPEHTAAEVRRDYVPLVAAHARRADAVIVNSAHTGREVASRLHVQPERIAVCPPGAPAWDPRTEPAPAGPILFIGTLEPRKNLGTLLAAYQRLLGRLPAVPPLILAGRVTPQSQPILEALRSPLLARHAQHVGYVSDSERQRHYREASMVVVPSFNEGFGMPALEAMTMGVPVVASNGGALPELVMDAGLLVDPDNDGMMANAMERVLIEEGLARRLAAAGVRRAASYRWSSSAAVLLDAYAAAVARRRARS